MNKYTIGLIIMILALLSLIGCGRDEKTDYSEYTFFTDIDWCRETEIDVEHICFSSDGSFSYYYGCGNPANDSDLCEGYTYDDETRTITLKYPKPNESIVTTIRIKDYDENSIELDFEGDIRIFTKENQAETGEQIQCSLWTEV